MFILKRLLIFKKKYFALNFRSQIKQTLKKKAFEEAGIPVKQISMIQTQPKPSTSHATPETIYVKNDPDILSAIPSTSTAIIVTQSEPPAELMGLSTKSEDLQMVEDINLLTNPDAALLSSDTQQTADDSSDSNDELMEGV